MSPALTRTQGQRRADALKYLAVARQADPDPAVGVVYLKGLEDIDAGYVERACEAFGKESRADFAPTLPSLGEIRERCERLANDDAVKAAAARILPMPKADDEGPVVFCRDCNDESSSFRMLVCFGVGALRDTSEYARYRGLEHWPCGRTQRHGRHAFVERCHCYKTNPVVNRRREQEQTRPAPRPS